MDIIFNKMDSFKPSKRLEYLQLNNYENPEQIMSDYIKHTKQIIKDNYNNAVATRTAKILEKPQPSQSVNFDTINEPHPLYDYNDWRNSEIKECEPTPINKNREAYMIDICEGVYRIIINETTTIVLDINSKTFKITDNKATENKTILNIKI